MGQTLKRIMNECSIQNSQYMVIAGYCLHKYKTVGDLDVIVEEGEPYNKLKNSGLFEISLAKISNDERLVLKLTDIDDEAEIEIFPKSRSTGFPSNYYSLNNLQDNNLLICDDYGNPYYGESTSIKQYCEYQVGNVTLPKPRIEKNLLHLKIILTNVFDAEIKKYCKEQISLLEDFLSKITH